MIARLERAIRKGINERVRPYGLTTLQYTTLSVLRRTGPAAVECAACPEGVVTPQAMGEVIEKLEKMHLLKRVSHPNHRRVYPRCCSAEEPTEVLESAMRGSRSSRRRCCTTSTTTSGWRWFSALTSAVQALGAGLPQHVR